MVRKPRFGERTVTFSLMKDAQGDESERESYSLEKIRQKNNKHASSDTTVQKEEKKMCFCFSSTVSKNNCLCVYLARFLVMFADANLSHAARSSA